MEGRKRVSNSLEILDASERRERHLALVGEDLIPNNETALVPYNDDFIQGVNQDYLIFSPLTDTGNAECFLSDFGDNYRFNKTNGKWYVWDNVVWQKDEREEINHKILETIRRRQREFAITTRQMQIEERQRAF